MNVSRMKQSAASNGKYLLSEKINIIDNYKRKSVFKVVHLNRNRNIHEITYEDGSTYIG